MTTKVPADTSRLHELVYGISDGLFDPSRASVLVRPVKDWVNPPIARDDVAAPKPGETSTLVDALANDTDIDSDPETLKIVDVLSPDATVEAGQVRVTILDHPYAVPYVIEDEDGARAMALIQVPDRRQRPALRRRRQPDPDGRGRVGHRRAERPREVAARSRRLGDDGRDRQRLAGAEPRGDPRGQPHPVAAGLRRLRRPGRRHARGDRPGRRRPEGLRHGLRVDPRADRPEGPAPALPRHLAAGRRRRAAARPRHPAVLPRLAPRRDVARRRRASTRAGAPSPTPPWRSTAREAAASPSPPTPTPRPRRASSRCAPRASTSPSPSTSVSWAWTRPSSARPGCARSR